MYSNKFVACIKVDGKILREKGDEVYLPFGSEYTIYFKNEHSRKVQINVTIDGQDILFGKSLLLNGNDSMDLKGFVRDKDGIDNRAFRFITKTQEISDFRGDKPEDGLIKITYQFEDEPILLKQSSYPFDIYQKRDCYGGYSSDSWGINHSISNNIPLGGNINTTELYASNAVMTNTVYNSSNSSTPCSTMMNTTSINAVSLRNRTISDDPGITVEGKETNQSFKTGFIGRLENKIHTMIFQLKGLTKEEQLDEPITVETKKQCSSCGKKFKSTFEYCPFDGTFLRF